MHKNSHQIALSVATIVALTFGVAAAHAEAPQDIYEEIGCTEHEPSDDEIVVFASVVDCTISTNTGYSQGVPFDIDVVQVDSKAVEVDTANAFLVMQAAAELDGVGLGIVSGFRSYEEQEYLYGCYVNCNCNSCNLAARPGYSNHNSGHALDLNASAAGVYDWLAANAAEFGFERTVPSENWHWEWWGGGPGGGECGIEERVCAEISADGRIIEETDNCFVGGGQRQYLREVIDGHEDGLIWTKATDSEEPSNYGIWNLNFAASGRYELLVFTDNGEYGQSTQARYIVSYVDGEEAVIIDQSSSDGWLSLGTFSFATETEHSVRLNDNTGEPWAEDPGGVRLMFDALQLVPEEIEPGSVSPGEETPDPEAGGGLIGACSAASQRSAPLWFLLLGALAFMRRRRRS
jgi:MYXO-CTERM domain-containing protein